ncbi:MAG: YceI family protein [Thermoflavifilum sp.]|nr:YceI family protein [Thermoflavifilum sp.]
MIAFLRSILFLSVALPLAFHPSHRLYRPTSDRPIADILICRNAHISFYSPAPIEDIKAETDQAVSALNTANGSLYFKVMIRSFTFRRSLMQEHFNEDFMESDRYPYAEFKGNVLQMPDLSKDGNYPVQVQGTLTIHGVSKNYTVPATLTVKNKQVSGHAVFLVKLADHHIQIPRLLMKDIAEQVQVTVDATYSVDNNAQTDKGA